MDKFDSTCRTCNANRLNLVNFYTNSLGNDSVKIYDALCSVCPSLSIQNDDKLPQKICFFCSKQLEIAYKFQQQCKKSDEDLWKVVKNTIKKEPSNEQLIIEKDEQSSENEQIESETCDEFSLEEAFEDTITVTGSPEFLEDDDEDMETISQAEAEPVKTEEPSAPTPSYEDSSKVPFDCNLCDKKYLTSNGLVLHMKLGHKNSNRTPLTETFQCKYCDLVFDSQDERKQHSHSEHKTDSKSEVTCYICQKSFLGKNKLDHHLMYHGKSQFKCQIKDCKRAFTVKYKLTDHLKRFHGIVLSINQSRALKSTLNKEL